MRRERFLLLRRDNDLFPYYTIRAQDVNAKKALKRQRDMYTGVVVLLDILCHPNTKTFYVRIKEDLKKRGVEFHLCEISIASPHSPLEETITEEVLIREMMKINDEKKDV
jgi:predicted peroxiredoxin